MSKLALLGAFLAALVLSIACADDDSEPAALATATATGMDRLDLVIDRLLARDVDGLVELVEFTPRGCVERSTVGAPPTCQPGQELGSPVSTFATGGCEGTFLTDVEEVREHFDRVLAASDELSLYAVLRREGGYVIAVTLGSVTSFSLPGRLWWVSDQGTIEWLSLGCDESVAQRIDMALPEAQYVVGPLQGECRPGPGEVADLLVDIEAFHRGGFFGPASPVQGRPSGEIVKVFVDSETQLDGGPGDSILAALERGTQVRVTGERQDDCSIKASNIIVLPATATSTATGIDSLDRVIERLLARDVDGLVELVEFTPRGCVAPSPVGAPPTCQAGQNEGTPIPAFLTSRCEGFFLTTMEDVRRRFERVLAESDEVSLYAVARAGEAYAVAITWDPVPSPTSQGHLWYVGEDGKIQRLSSPCGSQSIAMMIDFLIPDAEFVVGPLGTCSPGPGDKVELIVSVESKTGSQFAGQLYGGASTPLHEATGERAIVDVTGETQWEGPITRFGDVRSGAELQVTGERQDDCSIKASNIMVLQAPTPRN